MDLSKRVGMYKAPAPPLRRASPGRGLAPWVAPLAAVAPFGRASGLPTALFGTLTTLQSASRTRRCRTSSSANVL